MYSLPWTKALMSSDACAPLRSLGLCPPERGVSTRCFQSGRARRGAADDNHELARIFRRWEFVSQMPMRRRSPRTCQGAGDHSAASDVGHVAAPPPDEGRLSPGRGRHCSYHTATVRRSHPFITAAPGTRSSLWLPQRDLVLIKTTAPAIQSPTLILMAIF